MRACVGRVRNGSTVQGIKLTIGFVYSQLIEQMLRNITNALQIIITITSIGYNDSLETSNVLEMCEICYIVNVLCFKTQTVLINVFCSVYKQNAQ